MHEKAVLTVSEPLLTSEFVSEVRFRVRCIFEYRAGICLGKSREGGADVHAVTYTGSASI